MIEQKFDFFKKQQSLKTNEKLLKQLKKVTKKDKKQKLNAQGKTFLHQHLLEYHYKYSVMLNGNLEFFLNSTKIFFFTQKQDKINALGKFIRSQNKLFIQTR